MIKEKLEFVFSDENIFEQIKKNCYELENFLQKEGIGEILFTIINEITTNAIKANLKRIFFIKNGYSFQDDESYKKGLWEFKQKYRNVFKHSKEHLQEKNDWLEALRDLGLTVQLEIDANEQRILIYVKNNTKILPEEEKKLRESLSIAMKSKDLVDYMTHYIENVDLEEGESLGLPLVVLLIRNLGFSPEYFRVYKDNQYTIARIELPLSVDYSPIRKTLKKNLED